jgi:hypothetical protein
MSEVQRALRDAQLEHERLWAEVVQVARALQAARLAEKVNSWEVAVVGERQRELEELAWHPVPVAQEVAPPVAVAVRGSAFREQLVSHA